MHLNSLPQEVKWKILTYSSLKEIFVIIKKKYWKRISLNDNFWKEIYQRYDKFILELKTQKRIGKSGKTLYEDESEKKLNTYKKKVLSLWEFFIGIFFSNESWMVDTTRSKFCGISDKYFPYFKKPKLVVIGQVSVGKSSMINIFVKEKFSEDVSLISTFSSKTVVVDKKKVSLSIWDTAGKERFFLRSPHLSRMFYQHTHGAVLCFDVSDRKSFNELDDWYINILENTQRACQIVCVGCKTDLEDKRVVKYEEAVKFCSDRNIKYFECSSKESVNVFEIFLHVARSCSLIGDFWKNEIEPYYEIVKRKLREKKVKSSKKKCQVM